MDLTGRTALVTGSARGIGRGIALALAQAGCNVSLADRVATDELRDQLEETRRQVEALGRTCTMLRTDVTDELDVRAMVAETERVLGPVAVLVNNAGVISLGAVVDLSVEEFRRVLDVNVIGTFLCCKTVLPSMLERREGCIINLASIAGKRGYPKNSHYCASKFAVIGFTQSLAMEVAAAGIRVNAICPGYVESGMWSEVLAPATERQSTREQMDALANRFVPLRRLQTPEDIGQAAVFLCQADNITGEALVVAGGMVMD